MASDYNHADLNIWERHTQIHNLLVLHRQFEKGQQHTNILLVYPRSCPVSRTDCLYVVHLGEMCKFKTKHFQYFQTRFDKQLQT